MKKPILAALCAAVALLLAAGCAPAPAPTPAPVQTQPPAATSAPTPSEAPAATEAAPVPFGDFAAPDIEGNDFTQEMFADYDLTMINIWATFCSPCLQEMPDLGELAAEYKDKGVQIVGIVVDVLDNNGDLSDSQLALAKEIVQRTNANYTHLLPSWDLINAKLQYVSAVPETIFVDREGNLVGKPLVGSRTKEGWQTVINGYLEDVK